MVMNLKKPAESEPVGSLHLCFDRLLLQTIERIARKQTRGTRVSWEDAQQVAYEKVLQATQAGKFRKGGVEEFYHWAATVARFAIIDLVRHEQQFHCQSLDQNIPGTDVPLSETIADEFNLSDAFERADLVLKAIEAIALLNRLHPDRAYLQLWQGRVEGKSQAQLAAELGVTQGAISKRWKELCHNIAQILGLLQVDAVKQELGQIHQQKTPRTRSQSKW
jgi:RNA polymerase sporulation-specific sigma factor